MRKCSRAAFAAFLFLVISSISHQGFAREIAGRKFVQAKCIEKRPSAKESAVSVVAAVGLDRCKSKKVDLCGNLTRIKENSTSLDDDKRVVPTGPNPLHNR